ncbi:MAG: hypothetical protein IKQ29_00450 [Bacilli bacterium]|nr:hypothetical protein [Bacilli bacterium]
MKKGKYLIFSLFILFSCTKLVSAVTCDVLHGEDCNLGDKNVPIGSTAVLYADSKKDISSLSCSSTMNVRLDYNSSTSTLSASFRSGMSVNVSVEQSKEYYHCEGKARNGITFHFNGSVKLAGITRQNLVHAFTPDEPTFDVKTALNATEFLETTKNGTAVSLDCAGSKCVATASDFSKTAQVNGTITYRTAAHPDVTFQIYYSFSIATNSVYAVLPSGCNTSSWTVYNGQTYYRQYEDNLSLPTCSNNPNESYKKFAGWLQSDTGFPTADDKCTGANASASVAKRYNVACYKVDPHFVLNPNGGTIKNNTGTPFYGAYLFVTNSLSLPDVEPPDGYEFVGWTSATSSTTYKAGQTVTSTGKTELQAIFTQSAEEGADTVQYSLNLNKHDNIEVNTYFGLNINTSKSVNFNSADSSKVTATTTDGKYFYVTAGDTSTGSDYVVVRLEYTNKSGKKVTALINVFVSDSDSYFYDSEDEVDDTIPSSDPTPVTTGAAAIGGMVSGKATACQDGYIVKWLGKSHKVEMYKYAGDTNYLLEYSAKNGCDGKQYPAICVDPGLNGPNNSGKLYYPAEKMNYPQIDPSKGGWDAGIYYLAGVIHDNPGQYYEVNFAARVLTYKYGYGKTGGKYAKHADSYVAFANQVGDDGTFPSSPSGFKIASSGASIIAGAQSLYKEALNYAGTTPSSGTGENNELSAENTTHESHWEGHTFVYIQEGDIISGDGTAVTGLKADCLSPYTCKVLEATPQGNNLHYKVELRITIQSDTIAPNVDLNYTKFIIELGGDSGSNGSAFLLYPAGSSSSSYQRFIVFHPAEASAYLYVTLEDGDCTFFANALNGNCTDAASCAQVNLDWWLFLNCCDDLDSGSFAYEYLCSGEDCFSENYLNECEYKDPGKIDVDIYSVREAETKEGTKKYKCIVAISKKCTPSKSNCSESEKRQATETKKDLVGNKYAIDDYIKESNQFCRVSCKEDWNFGSSAFGNYTGDKAVEAGSYFMINKDLFIGTTRTCVTTKIDYKSYAKKIETLANEMREAWNKENYYRAKYQQIEDNGFECNHSSTGCYYNKSHPNCYHPCPTEENPSKTCNEGTHYDATCDCKEYKIQLKDFEYKIYKKDGSRMMNTDRSCSEKASQGCNIADDSNWSKTTSNTSAGSHWSGGGTCQKNGKESDCNKLKNDMLQEAKSQVDLYRSIVAQKQRAIDALVDDFVVCQNFVLNVTKGDFVATGSNVLPAFGDGLGYTTVSGITSYSSQTREIESSFDPFIQYTYDEDEYMEKLIEYKENYMTYYKQVNTKALGQDYFPANNVRTQIPDAKDDLGRPLYIARNFYTTDKYKVDDDAEPDETIYDPEPTGLSYRLLSEEGAASTFGDKDLTESLGVDVFSICTDDGGYRKSDSAANKCDKGKFNYYEANFIKHSLSNSSYFRNFGDWYINTLTDEKVHSELIDKPSGRIPDPSSDWSLYGGHNVFPISMDTKRNLYKYEYKFYNIGMYNDGSLGRIMGHEFDKASYTVKNESKKVLIEENYHDCLYEVYESICRCCGEEIVTYAYVITGREGQDPPDYIIETGAKPGNSTNTVVNEAQISAYTNTVSLSNVASATQRVLGANWQARTPFYLGGKLYEGGEGTNQGDYLLKGIEEKGDELYDETPEYSYILNPSTLASIRNYNKSNSYVPDTTSGKFTAAEGTGKGTGFKKVGTDWLVSTSEASEHLRFFHYKSAYLKDTLSSYQTPAYSSSSFIGRDKICYISGSESELESAVKYLVKNGPNSDCLWVDYITPGGIRLAFK